MPTSIAVDARSLTCTTLFIPGISGLLAKAQVQTVGLDLGQYVIQTHGTSDTGWQFEITAQGLVDYAPTLDVSQGGFLTGRGSTNLGVLGFPITLDGTGTTTRSYFLNGITNSLDNTTPQPLNLLPGRYQFWQGNGAVPEADFQVRMDGTVDFPASSDAILEWRDADRTLAILGFAITLDGTGTTTQSYFLNGITNSLDNTTPQPLNLLPGRYQFWQGNGAVPEADFQVRMDGTVDFPASSDAILEWRS